jgi:N-glycosylase/DNA lyase
MNNFFVISGWVIVQSEDDAFSLSFTFFSRYLYESSQLILSHGGIEWLNSLRTLSYVEIQSTLMTLPGIGRKVADCVALFSLDQIDAIPVDTHIWSITNRDYSSHSRLLLNSPKTLTDKIYQEIQRIFKEIFERYVGWAHSLLFAGELSDFRHLLPATTQEEMRDFDRNKKELKKSMKKKKQKKEVVVSHDDDHEGNVPSSESKHETKQRKKRKNME